MAEIQDLDVTDANNVARWPENMQFRNVNNAGRADEGMLARWYKDTNGSIAASGSASAYAITVNRAIAAYTDGLIFSFTANHNNSGASTLAVSGLAAKTIVRPNGDNLIGGDIINGQKVTVVYVASLDKFQMLSAVGLPSSITIPVGTLLPSFEDTVPTGMLAANGQAVSRSTYAALFAKWGTRFGAGDGLTTFNVIDMRGEFLRGRDAGAGVDPDAASRTNRGDGTTGDNVGTKQTDQLRSHLHSFTGDAVANHRHFLFSSVNLSSGFGGVGPTQTVARSTIDLTQSPNYDMTADPGANEPTAGISSLAGAHTPSGTIGNTGGNETRPTNIACDWLIVALPAAVLPTSGIGKVENWIGARMMTARAANGAASGTRDSGGNDVTQPVFDFDDTNQEFVHFEWVPPKRWNKGTVSFVPYWTSDAASAAQTVDFSLAGVAISNDDVLNATMGSAVISTDAVIAQGDLHIGPESAAITIGGTPALADLVAFQLARVPASDNATGDARLLGIKLIWTANATSDD